jgi:hypothetical protein
VVENFWETGYGMPSFTLLGSQVIRFPFILHSSYPHEILHNWWGNSVFVDYEQGNWCEGLTAYMADHLVQEQRGKGEEYRRNTLQKYRDYVNNSRDFPLSEFRSRHSAATEAVGYGKSLMLFHMLRRQIGDEAFKRALTTFYRNHRGQRAGFHDLRESVEEVVERDLREFFQQWVTRAGAPNLLVQNVQTVKQGNAFVVRGELQQRQEDEPFSLDVPVLVATSEGTKTATFKLTTKSQRFEIKTDAAPQLVAVDPQFDVFRMLDPRETPPSIGQIFGDPEILAVLPAGAPDTLRESYRDLIASWQSDDHKIKVVLDSEIEDLPSDRAAWILGRRNQFARLFPSEPNVVVSDSGVALAGNSVSWQDHCLVSIRRHPEDMNSAVGWIVVQRADAFAGLARKLPHYGKYSYLAFEGPEPTNTVKGQWDTTGSPLVVDLRSSLPDALADWRPEPGSALAELPPVFSASKLMAHVQWLAAPEREGRGLGTVGMQDAAQYIAAAMADAGLKPAGDNGTWFQNFTVEKGPEGRPVKTANVIGLLPGKNTTWARQSIIVCAHYDHLGKGWPEALTANLGKLHPGADDNASGVAVLLELARSFAAAGGGSRNLIVIAFAGEEAGRLGSKYYVDHPLLPLEEIWGVINLDAVGRLGSRKLAVHATATAEEWAHIFRGCSFVTGVESQSVPQMFDGSDQMSFIERGVPAVQIFTGTHADYHRPSDTPDKIDAPGLVKVATFVKEAVAYLLERAEPMAVKIEGAAETVTTPPSSGGRRVLFGTVPAFDYQGEGVKVDDVTADSPAANAGIRGGDLLTHLDGKPLKNLREYAGLLREMEPGQEVQATIVRDGKTLKIPVTVVAR